MKRALTWFWHEFKTMLPAAVFFLATFHMLAFTKAVLLSSHGLSIVKTTTATVAALLVAKAVLVVDNLPFTRYFDQVFWHNLLWRIWLFYLVTLVFHLLEGAVSFYLQSDAQSFDIKALLGWVSWPHFFVVQMWLIFLLALFTCLRETIQLIGHDQFVELITRKRSS